MALGGSGAGPRCCLLFVCFLWLVWPTRGGGFDDHRLKAKPLSAGPRGLGCCGVCYFFIAFLLSPATSPPNNSAEKAVRP